MIERRNQPNPWEAWGFRVADVCLDSGSFGDSVRTLRDDGETIQWLYPGFPVTLHSDEAEGYHLNLESGRPVWFVMWRIDDEDPSLAMPERVTLSYNEAARQLDAQERVDNLPLPTPVRDWLQSFTDVHYRPEPKKRRKPASFLAPDQR